MKEITSYCETTDNCQLASVKEGIGKPTQNKHLILNYFHEFDNTYTVVTCAATDYITGKKIGSESIKTYNDGVYVWTNEEVFLFNKYDLKLNDDFIQHILTKSVNRSQ